MDTSELKKIGAQTLVISLELCEASFNKGSNYGAKSDFHAAIREFTIVINLFPGLVELMESLNLPKKLKIETALMIVKLACGAYAGRALAYTSIGEREKGNADMIMAERVKNTLNVPSQSENPTFSNLSQMPPTEIVDFQSIQYTNSSNDIQFKDFEYTRIGSGIKIEKYIGSATSVIIPNYINNLPVTTIGKDAFYNCKSLTSIQIPNSVKTIGEYAFYNCKSLTSVQIPNSVTTIGRCAFLYCESLTFVQIPNSVTTIGKYAFRHCHSLTSVQIPNSVTTIDEGAFDNCQSLMSIQIPNSVTTIGENAFWGCTSLTSVQIPNSVTTISDSAFYNCTSLTSVLLLNPNTIIGKNAFLNCNSSLRISRGAETEVNKKNPQNIANSQNISENEQTNDFSLSKFLFWMAIVIFIIALLIACFTGISLGNSLLLTVGGIVALIIWIGTR